jgi:hypothetical protein
VQHSGSGRFSHLLVPAAVTAKLDIASIGLIQLNHGQKQQPTMTPPLPTTPHSDGAATDATVMPPSPQDGSATVQDNVASGGDLALSQLP